MKIANKKSYKKYILPAAAGMIAIAAAIILIAVPEKGGDKNQEAFSESTVSAATTADAAEPDENGEIIIRADFLSKDRVSFIRVSDDSRIELLARLGDDGTAKVALGTCQSCNGAPGAYYTQDGDVLKCNNCGLTFPLSVIDSPGGGCHPMMNDTVIRYSDGDAVINVQALSGFEELFAKVAEH